MRIVGGLYRSRLIEMPDADEVRPTQDKVRQAVFNIIRDIEGKRVLDLYAGSGAYGIEALSRGALHATFVDNNNRCIRAITRNVESLRIPPPEYTITKADASRAIDGFSRQGRQFDLIFLDPPYYADLAKNCLITLDACDIVARSALIVAERYKRDELPCDLAQLVLLTERSYGNTIISIHKKREG